MTPKDNYFHISKNYKLSKQEESEYINFINQSLKEFESQLDLFYSSEAVYYSIMPLGRKICETMLELLLKKEGYALKQYNAFLEIIQFSSDNEIIPQKYYESLNLIKMLAKEALHGGEAKYTKYLSFLKEFEDFISWFNINYPDDNEPFYVDEISLKIESALESSNNKTNYTIKPIKRKPAPSKYKFYKREEQEEISEINKLLTDYGKQLKVISSEKKFYYPFLGSTISERMLKLLIKKEGLYNPNESYTFRKCIEILYDHHIIPGECAKFLSLIIKHRNEFIHGTNQSEKLLLSFLKAFDYFIQWFDSYYSQNYQRKFQIEECCELIYSMTYDEINNRLTYAEIDHPYLKTENELKINATKINKDIIKIKKEIKDLEKQKDKYKKTSPHLEKPNLSVSQIDEINEKEKKYDNLKNVSVSQIDEDYLLNKRIKRLETELENKEEEYQNQIDELNRKTDEILKELDDKSQLLERCLIIILEQGQRIESKIDDLNEKMDSIANQIGTLQSFTERQIENAQSAEEIERIIETYMDECVKNIMNYSMNFTENQNYQMEKTKLIYSIEESGWNKLCEKSKTFLITSKVMYNHLILMDDIIDYSGICVLVTKALEVEIQRRFFTNFLDYLHEKYGRDYRKFHTALLYQNRKPLLSEKFTMGNIRFVMCYTEDWNDTYEQKVNNKLRLMEYCKECIFSSYDEDEIERLLNKYASSIEEIREKYRNPSAHTNEIKRMDAEACFNLVLDVEKLLKHMLDSFDA